MPSCRSGEYLAVHRNRALIIACARVQNNTGAIGDIFELNCRYDSVLTAVNRCIPCQRVNAGNITAAAAKTKLAFR
ncbi:hypothetical protein D3C80_1652530 [compost metagenome]